MIGKVYRRVGILMGLLLVSGLTACGNNKKETESSKDIVKQTENKTVEQNIKESETGTEKTTDFATKDTLVVVFSETGTTKGVAEKIVEITGADFYEIKPAEEYSEDDLDYNNSDSRATKEQKDSKVRPKIGSEKLSLDGYKNIYIGYPIWWGEEPRIMDTFVESYDFNGITMIPFCTSGSSGIGDSAKNLEDNAGSGNWLEGKRFDGSTSKEDLEAWINDNK